MTIEQMTPEEEVRLRLAAGISPSTPTEYMLRHIPLWVKMSILRRNAGAGGGGTTERVTTYDFTTNTYRKDGSKVSLSDISEFIRLSSATMWQDGQLVEVVDNIPRISSDGLLIEPQRTNHCPLWDLPEAGRYTKGGVEYDKGWKKSAEEGGDVYLYPRPYSVIPSSPILTIVRTGGNFTRTQFNNANYAIADIEIGGIDYYQVGHVGSVSAVESHHRGLHWRQTDGDPVVTHLQYEEHDGTLKNSTLIPTYGTPSTRAPDILNIPLLPSQTITGDWDEGVTYEVADNIATFTGHGYIRNITVEAL